MMTWDYRSDFERGYAEAMQQAEALARRHRARVKVLKAKLLPTALEHRVKAHFEASYLAEIERLRGPLAGLLDAWRKDIERKQQAAQSQRAQKLLEATKDVSPAALELFKAQVEKMTEQERLEAYKTGEPWQKLVIATWFRPERPRGNGLVTHLSDEGRELEKLIAQEDKVVRYDDQLHHIERLRSELRRLDPVGYHLDLERRFKISEPRLDLQPHELAQAEAEVARALSVALKEGER